MSAEIRYSFKKFRSYDNGSTRYEYKIVKEVREGRFLPFTRITFSEKFTLEEKIALEVLSNRVNKERRERGVL